MGSQLFSNNASALLAASINDTDTVVQVAASAGSLYPDPGGSQFFKIALVNDAGDLEICHCTSRTGDLLTVTRGQEGTTAQSWTLNATRVELRNTAETLEGFYQKAGDSLEGPMEASGEEIRDSRLTGSTVMVGGQSVNSPLRGVEDDASNEVAVPTDGSRATASGSPVITQADNLMTLMPVGAIILWYTGLGGLPAGWRLCDGSNGTPDMRGAFVRGAGGSFALGSTGGSTTASGNTGSGGAHTHTGTVAGHALSEAEMPAHNHPVSGTNSSSGSVDQSWHGGNFYGPAGVYGAGGVISYRTSDNFGNTITQNKGGDAAHSHGLSINSSGAHTHSLSSVSILPTYHAIYYIMKVS